MWVSQYSQSSGCRRFCRFHGIPLEKKSQKRLFVALHARVCSARNLNYRPRARILFVTLNPRARVLFTPLIIAHAHVFCTHPFIAHAHVFHRSRRPGR